MDADTIFSRNSVLEAIKEVSTKHVISYIYTHSVEANERTSYLLSIGSLEPHELGLIHSLVPNHVGSGWAMSSEMFWDINGWDENFRGWGWEDTALEKAYELLFSSEMSRAPGTCYRLWHPDRDFIADDNRLRYEELYNSPENNAEKMRSVLRGNMAHRLPNEIG
jgi:hypothetical protein